MIETRSELEELYFGDIDILAREYGVYAAIVDYGMSTHENSGRYLILSPEKQIVDEAKIGLVAIDSQLALQNSDTHQVYTNMKVIKLDDSNMAYAKKAAKDWLKDYELIANCFTEKKLPIPFRVLDGEVGDIAQFNKNRTSSAYETTDKFIDKQFTDFLKEFSKRNEKNESFKAIYNKNRKQEIKRKDDFYDRVQTSFKFYLAKDDLPAFKEYMKREPNCLYCIAKERTYTSFEVLNNGLSSGYDEQKEKVVTIVMDGEYKGLLNNFYSYAAKLRGEETGDLVKMEELSKEGNYPLDATIINVNDLDSFYSICNENRIPYAIDDSSRYKNPMQHGITVVHFKEDKEVVNKILSDIDKKNSKIYMNRHYITSSQRAKAEEVKKQPQKKSFFGF